MKYIKTLKTSACILTLIMIIFFIRPAEAESPDITELQALLRGHKFNELGEKIDYFTVQAPVNEDGKNNLARCIRKIIYLEPEAAENEMTVDAALLDDINTWYKESPQSWIPLAVRGQFYMTKAQEDLTRKEINPSGAKNIKDTKSTALNAIAMFKKARKDLNQSLGINPQSVDIYAMLIKLSRLAGDELSQAQEFYAKGRAIEPANFDLNLEMLKKYMASWGGDSNEEMLAFARKAAADNRPTTILGLLIPYAHREIAEYSDNPKLYYTQIAVWNEVLPIYLNLIEKYPESELLVSELSQFAYKANRMGSLKFESKYGDFYYWLGLSNEDGKDPGAAIENYTRALEKNNWQKAFLDTKANALYRRAGLLLTYRNNPSGALTDIEAAIKIKPAAMDFYALRSRAKETKSDWEGALNDMIFAIAGEPSRADFYNQRGLLYLQMKKYPKAVNDFNQAINIAPGNGAFYYNRGIVKINQKYPDNDSALEDFQSAVTFDPTIENAYYDIALILESKNDTDEAEKYYTKTIELNPAHAQAYLKRAQLLEKRGKFQNALADYSKAIENNNHDHALYFRRGVLLWKKLDNIPAAQDDLIKAAGLLPSQHNYIETLVLLADDLALIRHDYKRSLDIYDAVVKLAPEHPWAYNSKAWVLVTINSPHKNIREGIKLAQKSLELLDKEQFKDSIRYSQALDTLARAYAEIEDLDKALGYAKRAVALNPLNTENINNLHVLRIRWWKKFIIFWLKVIAVYALIRFIVKRFKKPKKDPWAEE